MNLAIEHKTNGKNSGNHLAFSAGLRGASLVSNHNSTTFFSRSPHSASENTERTGFCDGRNG